MSNTRICTLETEVLAYLRRVTSKDVRMVLNSVDVLVDSLREVKLLRPECLAQLVNDIAPKFDDSQELAKHIIRLGWITLYQAKKILSGHARELILGNYVITEKIGEGGMGKVYKAKQLRLNRTVALKVIRPNLLANEIALKRFDREAKAAAQLAHPNIVRLFDADHVGDRHFLAMEFVEGTDLSKLVAESGSLPVATACSFIRQAASGLDHAHELSLVHRDIKPSNLLVTSPSKGGKTRSGGVIKILDMGLARVIGDNAEGSSLTVLTQDGTVIGTPDYMSPEQAKNSSTVDGRSDQYSLGCTFYFLLTGQSPFPVGTTLEKLLQHQIDPPVSVQLLRHDVPDEVAHIVHVLLAKRPEDRFKSAGALAAALERFSSNEFAFLPQGSSDKVPQQPTIVQPLRVENATVENPTIEPSSQPTHADPFDFNDSKSLSLTQVDTPLSVEHPSQKRPPWRLFYAVGGCCLLFALILFVAWMRKKDDASIQEQPTVNEEPKLHAKKEKDLTNAAVKKNELEAIDFYLPSDTSVVVVLNVQQLAKSKYFQKNVLESFDKQLTTFKENLSFDPLETVERVILAIPEATPQQPVIIVQGYDFLTSDFLNWISQLPNVEITQERVPGHGMKKVYQVESNDKSKNERMYGAILSSNNPASIVLSPSKELVVDTLARVDRKYEQHFDDPSVKRMVSRFVTKTEKQSAGSLPTLWMCVGCETKLLWFLTGKKTGKSGPLRNEGILGMHASVRIDAGLDLDATIEGTSIAQAEKGWERIAGVVRFISSTTSEARVKRIAEAILDARQVLEPGGKQQGAAVATWKKHISPEKMSEWFTPLLATDSASKVND